jgi:hypothetical protein
MSDPARNAAMPWWVSGIIILAVVLMIAGAGIAVTKPSMMVGSHDEINNAVKIFAGYLFARNLALGGMLLVAFVSRNRGALGTLLLLAAFTQLLDGAVDCAEVRWAIAPGVIVLAVLFFAAASQVSGAPFWKAKPLAAES